MTKLIYSTSTLFLVGLFALLTPASAQSVIGSATVSGNLTISVTGIFFNTSATNTPANPLTPGSPNSGSFTGLSSGAIKNLPGLTSPGSLVIKSFATVNTPSGTIIFDLQSVAPGTGSPSRELARRTVAIARSEASVPAGAPLTLIQSSVNSVAIFVTLNGIAYPATAGPGSAGTAMSFTIQIFGPGTIPQWLAYIAAPTGFQNSYSATLSASN